MKINEKTRPETLNKKVKACVSQRDFASAVHLIEQFIDVKGLAEPPLSIEELEALPHDSVIKIKDEYYTKLEDGTWLSDHDEPYLSIGVLPFIEPEEVTCISWGMFDLVASE